MHYDDDDGMVGLIINRRAEISLSEIFPKSKHATADPTYMGGPVAITTVQALVRSSGNPDQVTRVVADIFITGAKQFIEKSIAARLDPSKFRVYLGYAG